MNIDYSLFPNLDGNLGQNKVKIPDGIVVTWPDGDILVGNFVYKNGIVSALVDTKALIANDSKTTTIPYDYFDVTFESIKEGDMTFIQGERCKYFTVSYVTDEDSNGEDDDGGSGSTPDSGDLTYTDLESLTLTASEFIDTQMVPPTNLLFKIDHKIEQGTVSDVNHALIFFRTSDTNFVSEGLPIYFIDSRYLYFLCKYSLSNTQPSPPPSIDYNRHVMMRVEDTIGNEVPAGYNSVKFENENTGWGAMPFNMNASLLPTFSGVIENFPISETLLINSMNKTVESGCNITHYSIKLYSGSYDDSSLIADMRPVQASNGQKGLYCNVRKIFMPVQTATGTAATTYSLRNNSPTIEEIIRMIAEEKGISLEA